LYRGGRIKLFSKSRDERGEVRILYGRRRLYEIAGLLYPPSTYPSRWEEDARAERVRRILRNRPEG